MKKQPLYPHVPKGGSGLPTKDDIVELDSALEQAHKVLIRIRFKMRSERFEFPNLFDNIDKSEKLLMQLGDTLRLISDEIGTGPFRR